MKKSSEFAIVSFLTKLLLVGFSIVFGYGLTRWSGWVGGMLALWIGVMAWVDTTAGYSTGWYGREEER